jgi:hypothetical protein
MDNMTVAEEARTKAINSENSAMDENEKYLNSITGRLGTLRSTIEEKYSESINSDSFKELITTATDLADAWLNLKSIALVLFAAFSLFNGSIIVGIFSNIFNVVRTGIVQFTLLAREMKATQAASYMAGVGIDSLKIKFAALTATLKANAFGIIVTALTALVLWQQKAKQEAQELSESQKRRNDELIEEQELLNKTKNYYEENYKKVKDDKQVKQELDALQEQLNKKFGDEGKSIDLVNGRYDEQIKKLKDLKKEKLEAALAEMKAEDKKRQTSFYTPALTKGFASKRDVTSSRIEYNEAVDYANTGKELSLKEYIAELKKMRDLISESGDESIYVGKRTVKSDKEKYTIIKAINRKLEELNETEEKHNFYLETQKTLIESNINGINDFTIVSKKAYDILSEKIEFKNQDDYANKLQEIANIFSGEEFKNIEDKFKDLDGQISAGTIS